MSGALSNLGEGLATLLFSNPRKLAQVIPDCAIEENHTDELMITEHPVERGANITDHAYIKPAEVTLRWGWSNSAPSNSGALFGLLPQFGASSEEHIKRIYDQLVELMQTRKTFEIQTGRRLYKSMLIQALSTGTDRTTEYSLIIIAKCRQVIIVETSTTQRQGSNNQPETAAPAPAGPATPTQAQPPRSSILNRLFGSPQ